MIWSLSTAKAFERCQRQWFFKNHVAHANAKNQMRQRAYRLSKLQSISGWRGSVVDQVLSQEVMPAFERGWVMTADKAIASAMMRFDRQLELGRSHRLHESGLRFSDLGDDFVAFHSLEYDGNLGKEEVEQARLEVRCAIQTFFSMRELTDRLRSTDRIVTQRALTFEHADTTVRAVPDVIAFSESNAPLIIDWKVHIFGWRDAWLQLAIYAAALSRCNPHKDFPVAIGQFRETDIELLEVQLLKGTIRFHTLTDEHFARADAYIARTAENMLLALGGMNGKASTLPPTDFPATRYASACERCPYRSMCWEATE